MRNCKPSLGLPSSSGASAGVRSVGWGTRCLVLIGYNSHVGTGQGVDWRGFIIYTRLKHWLLPTDTPWDCGDSA